MKKQLIVLLLIVFIVPSVAMASWWNPLSWGIFGRLFNRTESIETIPNADTINNKNSTGELPQGEGKEADKIIEIEKVQKETEASKSEDVSSLKENILTTDPTDCKISSFTVNGSDSATVAINEGAKLAWETSNCISITISGITKDGGFPLSGSAQLYHPQTRNYVLTAPDSNGSKVTKSVSVTVSSGIFLTDEIVTSDLPDLIVSDFSWNPTNPFTNTAGQLPLTITVKNIGDVAITLPEGMKITEYKDDIGIGGLSLGTAVITLNPGDSKTFNTFTSQEPNILETAGTFDFSVKVDGNAVHLPINSDSVGLVKELNENNNVLTKKITIISSD